MAFIPILPLLPRPPSPRVPSAPRAGLLRPSRRALLHLLVLPLLPPPALAGLADALAKRASSLPGAGAADVFYPAYFQGDWCVTRDLYSALPEAEAPRATLARLGAREEYDARFVAGAGAAEVVADRAFNARAEARAGGAERATVVAKPDVPNVMALDFGGGKTRETKVTKRSFGEVPEGGVGTFIVSEYARVADVEGDGGMPAISAVRRMTQYSVTSVDGNGLANEMAALVIEYVYPPSPPNAKPRLTLKYRQFLKRKEKGGLFRIPKIDF